MDLFWQTAVQAVESNAQKGSHRDSDEVMGGGDPMSH